MNQKEITIRFSDEENPSNAAGYAKELGDELRDEIEDLEVNHAKEDSSTQDFGATLILLLGAPAIVALAKGIAKYIARRPNAELSVDCGNGKTIKFKGDSTDAGKVSEALEKMCN